MDRLSAQLSHLVGDLKRINDAGFVLQARGRAEARQSNQARLGTPAVLFVRAAGSSIVSCTACSTTLPLCRQGCEDAAPCTNVGLQPGKLLSAACAGCVPREHRAHAWRRLEVCGLWIQLEPEGARSTVGSERQCCPSSAPTPTAACSYGLRSGHGACITLEAVLPKQLETLDPHPFAACPSCRYMSAGTPLFVSYTRQLGQDDPLGDLFSTVSSPSFELPSRKARGCCLTLPPAPCTPHARPFTHHTCPPAYSAAGHGGAGYLHCTGGLPIQPPDGKFFGSRVQMFCLEAASPAKSSRLWLPPLPLYPGAAAAAAAGQQPDCARRANILSVCTVFSLPLSIVLPCACLQITRSSPGYTSQREMQVAKGALLAVPNLQPLIAVPACAPALPGGASQGVRREA